MGTRPEDYTVGWICAIPTEFVAACELLDEEYARDRAPTVDTQRDSNSYTFGCICGHRIVIACLPKGRYGTTSAAIVAERMLSSFPAIMFGLMVGIAGGAPSQKHDIRLGDVVVSSPTSTSGYSGVIQYDFGKAVESHEFEETGHLAPSPDILLSALVNISTQHIRKGHHIKETISKMIDNNKRLRTQYSRPESDRLYKLLCDNSEQLITRQERGPDEDDPAIHYGLIASANRLMKDRKARDALIAKYDVLCFEMEAAGLMNNFPCVIIRGICDYSDIHKNDDWQGYAAATAAAYAKELLETIPSREIESMQFANKGYILSVTGASLTKRPTTTDDKINDFESSTNHDIQAQNVCGGFHHYKYQNTVAPQQFKPDNTAVKEAIGEADLAIHQYYMSSGRLDIERLSGEKLPLEDCYINLALVDQPSQEQDIKSTFSLEARLKLDAKDIGKSVVLEDLFKPRKLSNGITVVPKRIFIQGRAGVGKTTLCKKLVHEYSQGRLARQLFDRLLWIPLRRLKSKEEYRWQDLIEDTHLLPHSKWNRIKDTYLEQFDDSIFLNRTLLLFDGLDEISHHWKHDNKMYRFLENIICSSPNVIITSRPQSIDVGRFNLELETVGFLPDQIDAYLENCIPQSNEVARMKSFMKERPLIQGLLRIPVQLDAFCCTWPSKGDVRQYDFLGSDGSHRYNRDSISTMTTLYQSMSFELCRKDIARLERARSGETSQSRLLKNFEAGKILENELKFLCELAFQGMVNNVIEYSPELQDKIGSYISQSGLQLSTPYSSVLESMSFLRTSDIEQDQSKRNYHFIHLTFQEFFAAKHFAEHWQSDTPLTCLPLVRMYSTSLHSRGQILPFTFLQNEKYNPRYNIFWRFVTGLIQSRSNQCNNHKNLVDFFDELHKEPIDLLGLTHRRLLMYCLSEIVPDNICEFSRLRKREEDLLHEEAIKEYEVSDAILLAKETEFPEPVLLSLLKDERSIPFEVTFRALEYRPYVGTKTLNIISSFMNDKYAARLQIQAINVVFRNSQMASEDMLIRASRIIDTMSKHPDMNIQDPTMRILQKQSSLPQAITALITILRPEYGGWSIQAANTLKSVSLHQEAIIVLIAIFKNKDEDYSTKQMVGQALAGQSSLAQEAIASLTTILEDKDEDIEVRTSAAIALSGLSSPAQETINSLITILKDESEDDWLRDTVAYALGGQSSLPQNIINTLIIALTDLGSQLQTGAASSLLLQASLPQEAIDALVMALNDPRTRKHTAAALDNCQSPLPQEIANALITVLKDSDPRVRSNAAYALMWQPSLSQEAVDALITALGDENSDTRLGAVCALRDQASLPQKAINALVTALEIEDEDEFNMIQENAAEALIGRLSLPSEAINGLTIALKHHNSLVRGAAARALKGQSPLSPETINALIATVDVNPVYNTLHQCDIYSKIANLDNQAWQQLWSFWMRKGMDHDVCCYELRGSLYVWSLGTLHEISSNPILTRELLEVVLGPEHQKVRVMEQSETKPEEMLDSSFRSSANLATESSSKHDRLENVDFEPRNVRQKTV